MNINEKCLLNFLKEPEQLLSLTEILFSQANRLASDTSNRLEKLNSLKVLSYEV